MNLTIHTQPCLLLEAIELVHALVNQVPVNQLSGDGAYTIPEADVLQIMDAVRQEIRIDSEEVQFFFLGVPCEEKNTGLASIARHLVYSVMENIIPEPEAMVDKLCHTWKEYAKSPRIDGVRQYYVSIDSGGDSDFRSLSREIRKLPLPVAYQMQLLEAFSSYDTYLRRLLEVLTPVIRLLEVFLKPWVERAAPLLEQWLALLTDPENLAQFVSQRLQIREPRFTGLNFGLRYFQPYLGFSRCQLADGAANLLMGVGQAVCTERTKPAGDTPTDADLTALRLLSGSDRMAMLKAMLDKPMTGMELSQQLGLHSSSVFRDINSMNQFQFLVKEDADGKKAYRTNAPVLRQLLLRMADIFDR